MEDPYSDRVNKLFQRISNIQTDVEEEKNNRFKALKTVLINFEKKIEEHQRSRQERFDQLQSKLKDLHGLLEEDINIRSNMETDLLVDLKGLEKNCKMMIESSLKEAEDSNKKFLSKINRQIDQVAGDIQTELNKQDAPIYFQQYLDETLPKLKDDIETEILTRKDIETKILEQYTEQINELNEGLEEERKERERRSEYFMQLLKKVASRIGDNIGKSRGEREKNEEMVISLIEKVVERIRKDALELNE